MSFEQMQKYAKQQAICMPSDQASTRF